MAEPRLPGADLIERGLIDLARGVETPESLLVAIGAPRLRELGVLVPAAAALPPGPEHRLYDLLSRESVGRPHSEYNALVSRLVSYERALEREASRARR